MRIFFSVGEPSGDLHGANLIRDLRGINSGCEFVGFGGPKMRAAGQQQLADLTKLAVMFVPDTLRNLPKFWRLYRQGRRYLIENKVDGVVLIDFPGFNWWIAAAAKSQGIPVFYYGVPQMWAWASWRIRRIRRYVDHVLCKLPFEKSWFEQHNCQATYVGHPYFDEIQRQPVDVSFLAALENQKGDLVTLLPGSRTKEIQRNLPVMLRTMQLVGQQVNAARFAVACFNEEHAKYAAKLVEDFSIKPEIHAGRTPELIRGAKCCLACSGSVSLELLSHLKPSVVHYGLSPIGNLLQRIVVKSRYITLVNLLATDRIERIGGRKFDPDAAGAEDVPFPEYLAVNDKSAAMAKHLVRWLTDEAEFNRRVDQLTQLRDRWGQSGASQKASEYIVETLDKRKAKQSVAA